jgi:transposase
VQDRYQWLWLYAAVEPDTGESCCVYLPSLDGVCFQRFLAQVRRTFPEEELLLVMDQAGSHLSEQIVWPEQMQPLLLPPYSPELNPVERWFEELRAALANQLFATLEALDQALTQALQAYWEQPGRLAQLTGFGWWRKATAHIRTED